MPETTPLIKAALHLRAGVGFDVYLYFTCSSDRKILLHNLYGFPTKQKTQRQSRQASCLCKRGILPEIAN